MHQFRVFFFSLVFRVVLCVEMKILSWAIKVAYKFVLALGLTYIILTGQYEYIIYNYFNAVIYWFGRNSLLNHRTAPGTDGNSIIIIREEGVFWIYVRFDLFQPLYVNILHLADDQNFIANHLDNLFDV